MEIIEGIKRLFFQYSVINGLLSLLVDSESVETFSS